LASSGEAAGFVFVTERMRLFSAPHPQLSVIPLRKRLVIAVIEGHSPCPQFVRSLEEARRKEP
jgi:hypothetical protein